MLEASRTIPCHKLGQMQHAAGDATCISFIHNFYVIKAYKFPIPNSDTHKDAQPVAIPHVSSQAHQFPNPQRPDPFLPLTAALGIPRFAARLCSSTIPIFVLSVRLSPEDRRILAQILEAWSVSSSSCRPRSFSSAPGGSGAGRVGIGIGDTIPPWPRPRRDGTLGCGRPRYVVLRGVGFLVSFVCRSSSAASMP